MNPIWLSAIVGAVLGHQRTRVRAGSMPEDRCLGDELRHEADTTSLARRTGASDLDRRMTTPASRSHGKA